MGRAVVCLVAASIAAAVPASAQEPAKPLPVTLVGTGVSTSNREPAWALIRNVETGQEEPVQLHEPIFGLGTLAKVAPNEIYITLQQGGTARLQLNGGATSPTPGAAQSGGRTYEIQEQRLPGENAVETISQGLTSLEDLAGYEKEETRMVDGEETLGLVYDDIPGDSLLATLGVQSNDFIYYINDRNSYNSSEIFDLKNYLTNVPDGEITVRVVRNGKPLVLRTTLPQKG